MDKNPDLVIRLCRPGDTHDFSEIDRLERECAQGTLLRFHFAPDDPKNPRPRAFKFPNSIVTVAENADGRMVGTISGIIRTVRFGSEGRYEKVGWVFSLRVGLDQRRTGVATKLIQDMEKRLRNEHGVRFVFDSLALDNIPSVRLFEKLGYSYMWKTRFYGINISHTNKMLDKIVGKTEQNFILNKLDPKQSKAFLHKHYAKSFMYPEDGATVFDSNIYTATQGDNLVAVNLWREGDKMGIVAIPVYLRLLYYVMILLSFLFPNLFEKPLPLSRPWQMRWIYPILVDVSSRDKNLPRDLFNATITQAVRDLKSDGCDVLMMPMERAISGLSEANQNLVRKCSFVSPLMRGSAGILEIGKALDEDKESADEIVATATKQSFWFLNNSI